MRARESEFERAGENGSNPFFDLCSFSLVVMKSRFVSAHLTLILMHSVTHTYTRACTHTLTHTHILLLNIFSFSVHSLDTHTPHTHTHTPQKLFPLTLF